MTIRQFQPQDRQAVCDIAAAVFEFVSVDAAIERRFGTLNGTTWQDRKRRDVASDLDAEDGCCFVAEDAGTVVGFVTILVDRLASVGRIPNLAVAQSHQGRHVGKALLSRALDYIAEQGLEFSQIETLDTNERGMRFYPQMGYQEVARRICYFMRVRDRKDR